MELIRLENVKKIYKTGEVITKAVDGIDFTVNKGEFALIIGASGAGKTTVFNLLTGVYKPTEGIIRLDGEDITLKTGKSLRMIYRKMQMVFQTPTDSFDPRRTLGDGIGESLRNCGMTRHDADAQAERLLERCGLPASFAGRYPHEVSGGQCQRAAIARAIAQNPRFLICDEATSALDVSVQAQIMELLIRIRKEKNLSILFIPHDLALVSSFCDRIYVLNHGKVVESGETAQIIHAPQQPYTKKLIASLLTV